MDHIGIDVHQRETQISIPARAGEVAEQRIRAEAERCAAVLGTRLRARTGLLTERARPRRAALGVALPAAAYGTVMRPPFP